jgi:TonB family protein
MRSGCALLVWLFVWSPAATALQSTLPAQENLLVVGARAMRQPNTQAPLELTLTSGRRITVSPQDVHEAATNLVRSAMIGQAYRAVEPSLLFVLHIRELTPVSKSDVKVTLSSGAVIRVRSSDVNDVRLTFLRTVLAQARSGVASVGSAQSAHVLTSEPATATIPVKSATSAPETSERPAPTGAEQPAQAGAPPGVEIQCDAEKVDFDGPWLRRFVAQIRRFWLVPYSQLATQGHVRLKFVVHKDGRITDVTVVEASSVAEFNKSAVSAVTAANPTIPLPPEYPFPQITLCVTFYFNETPGVERGRGADVAGASVAERE